MRWMPKNFNEGFAVFLTLAMLAIFILVGRGLLPAMPGEVLGALLTAFGLIVQFFFRKSRGEPEAQ